MNIDIDVFEAGLREKGFVFNGTVVASDDIYIVDDNGERIDLTTKQAEMFKEVLDSTPLPLPPVPMRVSMPEDHVTIMDVLRSLREEEHLSDKTKDLIDRMGEQHG